MIATSTSSVATLDNQTATIAVASGYQCTIDGSLAIDTTSGTYGELVVDCDTLDFGGTLVVHLSGPNDGECDELVVNGILDLDSGSELDPPIDGDTSNSNGYTYTVISASGGIENSFSYVYPINNEHWRETTDTFVEIYGYG